MTDEKELDKLYYYGIRLLDSIECDYLSEIQRADKLESELEEERENCSGIVMDLKNILNKVKGQGTEYGRE